MATLPALKKYMEVGKHGRPCPLSEIKELSAEEREELCSELDKLTEDERSA